MAKKYRCIDEHAWLNAANIADIHNWVEYGEFDEECALTKKTFDAETLLLKKEECFGSGLSKEAQEVLSLIINTPTEMIDFLKTQKVYLPTKLTQGKIKRFLRYKNKTTNKRIKVKKVMKEIQSLIRSF